MTDFPILQLVIFGVLIVFVLAILFKIPISAYWRNDKGELSFSLGSDENKKARVKNPSSTPK